MIIYSSYCSVTQVECCRMGPQCKCCKHVYIFRHNFIRHFSNVAFTLGYLSLSQVKGVKPWTICHFITVQHKETNKTTTHTHTCSDGQFRVANILIYILLDNGRKLENHHRICKHTGPCLESTALPCCSMTYHIICVLQANKLYHFYVQPNSKSTISQFFYLNLTQPAACSVIFARCYDGIHICSFHSEKANRHYYQKAKPLFKHFSTLGPLNKVVLLENKVAVSSTNA